MPALRALADTWPTKPIKLVVPYAPGGTTDVVGRMIGEYLGRRLGQNIVVENRPGKGATIGTSQVAKAAPDGYTLVMSNVAAQAISPALYGDLDYDPLRDFMHITLASLNPSVLVVHPCVPGARRCADYIAYARANPDKLAFATSGPGSSNHILGVLTGPGDRHEAGPRPLSRRGAGDAGHDRRHRAVDVRFAALGRAAHQGRQGAGAGGQRREAQRRLPRRADDEGVGLSRRSSPIPGSACRRRRRRPQPIVERIAREMQVVLKLPEVVKRWEEIGAESSTMTPAEYAAFVKAELEKWTPVVKASGARPE